MQGRVMEKTKKKIKQKSKNIFRQCKIYLIFFSKINGKKNKIFFFGAKKYYLVFRNK